MKIDQEVLEDHQVKLTVETEPDLLEQAKRRAGKRLSRRTKIPGFRPGKAPYRVVERHVGEAVVLEEALDLLISDLYPQVIDESGVEPYGPGSLENILETDPPTFEFVVPLAPEVELGDYRAIRLPYEIPEVTEEDVEDALKQVQESQAIVNPVDRPAQEGDVVFLTLSGHRTDAAEGEDPTVVRESRLNYLIEPEEDADPEEWPFPGFARELLGLKAGGHKTIEYLFPEDYEERSLRGAQATFHIQVDDVKSRELPALDDELAQSVGDYETIDDVREYLRKVLEERSLAEYNSDYEDEIVSKTVEGSSFKIPPQMVDNEVDVLIEQLKDRLASQNLDLDTYLKTRQMDEAALREDLKPNAVERLKRGLVLVEVASKENIEVDPEEVENEATQTINQLYQVLSKKEARSRITERSIRNLVGHITSEKMAQRTIERLREIASGQVDQQEGSEPATEEAAQPEQTIPEQQQTGEVADAPVEAADAVEPDNGERPTEPAASPQTSDETASSEEDKPSIEVEPH